METNNSQNVNVDDQERSTATPAKELLRMLRWSMAQVLTPKQYQVFAMHFLDGVPQVVIAAELGMSRTAVSKVYNNALNRLRKLWNT